MEKEFQIKNRHILSLASVMFFAPIVHFLIKKPKEYELTKEDVDFIKGYIKYGFFVIFLFALFLILSIVDLIVNFLPGFVWYITTALLVLCLAFIIGGIFLVFTEKSVFQNDSELKYKKIKSWNVEILFCYIPLYNFYLWYTNPELRDYRWVKESFLFWYLWALLTIAFWSVPISGIILALLILRVISLIGWIDVLPDKYKENLNSLYKINPEEIFGYFKWLIIYLVRSFKKESISLSDCIETSKTNYQYLWGISKKLSKENIFDNKLIYSQYVLLILFLLYYFNIVFQTFQQNIYINFFIFALLLIVARFWIMFYLRKLPLIPVFNELVLWVSNLLTFLKSDKK